MIELAMREVAHDTEAEAALLGTIILDNRIVAELAHRLRPEHFYKAAHRLIYEAALYLASRSESIRFLTLKDELVRRGLLDKLGGPEALTSINRVAISVGAWEKYAAIVLEKAKLRALSDFARKLALDASECLRSEDADEVLNDVERTLVTLRDFNAAERPHRAFSDVLHVAFNRIDDYARKKSITGIPSGLIDLDKILGGFKPGEVTVIAGRPSMGKSTLATNIALHAALEHAKSVAIFSYETDAEQIAMNLIAMLTPADTFKMRHGDLPQSTWEQFGPVAERLAPLKIEIPDVAGFDALKIRSFSRMCKARPNGLDLVIVDYIGLVRPMRDVEPNRQQQVAATSRALKEIATELKVPVIVLSQLNRASDGRTDNRPTLSDLRESGAIEQDADVVLLLYREDYYKTDSDNKGIAEVLVSKHRNGPTGVARLTWRPEYLRFANLVTQQT